MIVDAHLHVDAIPALGWNLEAAEAVCVDDSLPAGSVLDLLTRLVNKSLVVVVRPPDAEARFYLLESIRQYAWAKLEASGEVDRLRRRHALYFCSIAPHPSASRVARERLMSVAHPQMRAGTFETAWAAGQSLTPAQAVELVLQTSAAG